LIFYVSLNKYLFVNKGKIFDARSHKKLRVACPRAGTLLTSTKEGGTHRCIIAVGYLSMSKAEKWSILPSYILISTMKMRGWKDKTTEIEKSRNHQRL
jgi:hypothetical protein